MGGKEGEGEECRDFVMTGGRHFPQIFYGLLTPSLCVKPVVSNDRTTPESTVTPFGNRRRFAVDACSHVEPAALTGQVLGFIKRIVTLCNYIPHEGRLTFPSPSHCSLHLLVSRTMRHHIGAHGTADALMMESCCLLLSTTNHENNNNIKKKKRGGLYYILLYLLFT